MGGPTIYQAEERRKGNPKWLPGVAINPNGRPKGSKNKINEDFLKAMAADFAAHGAEAIVKVREQKPEVYLKIVAGLVPRELKVDTAKIDDLPDDEIIAALDTLRSIKSKVEADVASAGESSIN